ncbi:cytochrome c oxidase subunit II [Roseomonas sp. M0104]|uniref:cytochrome-c oxidase n=1 Tax=Teichococcus coralli TaxID=2545983 RepID=A0A845B8J8_9PROT|nr:cytochrome c oxidase subunit II [Pseudoroseomonas coralli]MXP62570.1 cytochrome c oxidase subunit II [Pseudoroseomonas coralli]
MSGVTFWPPEASAAAARVDVIVIALLLISTAIVLLVGGLILGFSIRYRRGSNAQRGQLPEFIQKEVEVGWTAGTLFLALFLFGWASITVLTAEKPQADALEIHIEARQWMWKARHPDGAREINTLHLPAGEPVRLLMQSQDVIHSFFVPAFREKQDVLPGRITQLSFTPTEEGEFSLFCAEYCGTLHSRMGGKVVVMKPEDYARWRAAQPQEDDQSKEGEALFRTVGCSGCHAPASPVHAPSLAGLYGRLVNLADGRTVRADEAYLRDSILQPRRDIAAGYAPIMPTFAGILREDELQKILAYLMSLRREGGS